nr:restriction endonuclease subunit S [Acinetobacter sp. YH12211]
MAAPKLRFKEFDGDWSSVSLLEISTLITKGTTPKQFIEGNINFLKIEAITQNGFDLSKCQTISDEINNKELKRSVLMEGDILFAIAGATIGKNAIVQKELLPANTNQALAIIRLKENYSKIFISKVLNSPFMEKYIDINISTGAQPNLNLQQIGSFSFALPKLEEQTKIASFLSAVDEKISQLTQKHALLSQYKQGMMQKLFSQEIRFKADDGSEFGEWLFLEIGDVFKFKQGKQVSIEDQDLYKTDASTRFIRIVDLTSTHEPHRYIVDYSKNDLIEKDDLFMVRYGSPGLLGFGYEGVIANNLFRIIPIHPKQVFSKFSYYLFESLYPQVRQLSSSTTMPAISFASLNTLKVCLPCLEEQTKIANFLSAIDQKIEVVAQQIEQAKIWKKGLLQQMFV